MSTYNQINGSFYQIANADANLQITEIIAPNLTVSGQSNLSGISNVKIAGGSVGQLLTTDGLGNLSFATPNAIYNGNSNVRIATANGNVTVSVRGTSEVLTVSNTGLQVAGSLTVTADSNLGDLSNVHITGGSNGQVISTDGNGNLSFISVSSSGIANGNSNVRIATANGNVTVSVAGNNNVLTVTGTGANINGTLIVTEKSNLGPVGNVVITGGSVGQVLRTDGAGNLSFVSISSSSISNGNSNVNIATANGNVTVSVAGNTPITVTGTGINVSGTLNATGNANVGNINATTGVLTGTLSVTGNANVGNIGAALGVFTSNVNANVFNGNRAVLSGNVTAANFVGNLANGNTSINLEENANLSITVRGIANTIRYDWSSSNLLVKGNLITDIGSNIQAGGNLIANGYLRANSIQFIPGGSIGTANTLGSDAMYLSTPNSARLLVAGNIMPYAGNYTIGGFVDSERWVIVYSREANVSGNLYAGNLEIGGISNLGNVGNVKITGGSNGQVLRTDGTGNLSFATAGNPSSISNGDSNVSIATANGNINMSVGGLSVVTVSATSANISGTANVTENLSVLGNISTLGNIFAGGGNISAGNLSTSGRLTVTGNANAGNIGATAGVFTTVAGALTTATQPNITSVGTLTGLSMSGNINANSKFITNLSDPVNPQDAATKQYVDNVAEGLHTHDSCNVATPDTLSILSSGVTTYDNGANGIGATITTTGSYTDIDGITLESGMRILVKNEANTAHNGIYDYTNATALTRSADFNTPAEMAGGDFTFVTSGTIYDNTGWVMPDPVTTVGTSPVNWVQFSGAGTYTAGTGLTLNGSQFSISNTAVTAGSYGNGDRVPTFTVNSQGQLTAASNVAIAANAANLTGTTLNSSVVTSSLTAVGTLGNLTSNGNVNFTGASNVSLGAVGNVKITGGSNGQVLSTDGTGNLTWANGGSGSGSSISNGNSNVNIATANGNVTITAIGNTVATVTGTGVNVAGYTNIDGEVLANFANIRFSIATDNTISRTATGGQRTRLQMYGNSGAIFYNVETGYSDYPMLTVKSGGMTVGVGANFLFNTSITNANFTVSNGVSNLGAIGNVKVTGGSNGQTIVTDGSGNLSFTTLSQIGNGTSNVNIDTINGNVNISSNGVANVLVVTDSSVRLGNAQHRFVGDLEGNIYSNANTNLKIYGTNTYGTGSNLNAFVFDVTGAANGNVAFYKSNANVATAAIPYIESTSINTSTISACIVSKTYQIRSDETRDFRFLVEGINNKFIMSVYNSSTGVYNNVFIANQSSIAIDANATITGGISANGVVNFTNSPNVSLGSNANVKITGGSNGQFISTDGSGNLAWASVSTSSITNGNSNVTVEANSNVTVSVAGNANVVTVTGTGATVSGNLDTANTTVTAKLTVTGNAEFTGSNVSLGAVSNVKITGGTSGQLLRTDGTGNLSWTSPGAVTSIANGNSNINIATANGNIAVSVSGNANTVVFSGTGVNVAGTGNFTGNLSASNAYFTGSSNTVGNAVIGGNLTVSGGTINAERMASGNSNVRIVTANGNVVISSAGNTTATITGTGANIVGTLNTTGNVLFTGANIALGDIANIHIDGGSNGQIVQTDGAGNVSFVDVVSTNTTPTFLRGYTTSTAGLTSNTAISWTNSDFSSGPYASFTPTSTNITLQSGTFLLRGYVPASNASSASARPQFQWFNVTSSTWLGSYAGINASVDGAGALQYGGSAEALITVPAGQTVTVQLRLRAATGTITLNSNPDVTATQNPWFTVSMPSGQTVVTGGLDYVQVKNNTNLSLAANNTIVFNTIVSNVGGTIYNTSTGNFTLKANTTYRLVSSGSSQNSFQYWPFAWKWSGNNAYVPGQIQGLASTDNPGSSSLELIITMGAQDANVKLVVDGNNSGTMRANAGWAIAQAIGGEATTTNLTLLGNVSADGYVRTTPVTVANLIVASSAGAGARSFVTNANTTTFNAVVGAGGTNAVPVFSDGTNWRVG